MGVSMEKDDIDPKLPKLEDTEKNLIKPKIDDPLQMLVPLFEMLSGVSEKSEKIANEEMQIWKEILEELKGIHGELKKRE